MTEREQLLRAVLEQPDEDTVRLAFADWLDENGEPVRAALIRKMIPSMPDLFAFSKWLSGIDRVQVARHAWLIGEQWAWDFDCNRCLGSSRRPLAWVSRGFVYCVELPTTPLFLEHAEALFRSHPITEVRLTDREPEAWPSYYCWHHTDDTHYLRHADELPMCLWRLMDATTHVTDDGAQQLLSRACVAYGRELAGLPPYSPGRPAD